MHYWKWFIMDKDKLQNKIDKLPYIVRLWLRGGFVFVCWALPVFFPIIISEVLMAMHGIIVAILLYTKLDLRTDPDETWSAYRKTLWVELIMCLFYIFII